MSLSVQIERGNSYTNTPAHEPEDICLSDESFPDISRQYREELAVSLQQSATLAVDLNAFDSQQEIEDDTARDMLGREIDFDAVNEMVRATIIPFDYEPELMVVYVGGAPQVIQSPFAKAVAAEVLLPDPAAPVVGIEHLVGDNSTPSASSAPAENQMDATPSTNGKAPTAGTEGPLRS